MIQINGFYLSNYKETEGREGYGYCAIRYPFPLIKMHCYRYGPETFRASVAVMSQNGAYTYEEIPKELFSYSAIMKYVCSFDAREVIAEIKRLVRKKRKSTHYITYGFTGLEEPKRYYYLRGLKTKESACSSERLACFREVKRTFTLENWSFDCGTTGEFGANYQIENVTEMIQHINPHNPVIVKLLPGIPKWAFAVCGYCGK